MGDARPLTGVESMSTESPPTCGHCQKPINDHSWVESDTTYHSWCWDILEQRRGCCERFLGRGLTASKADDILRRNPDYRVTGVMLGNNKTGESCIVDMASVRWLDPTDWWTIMHPSPDDQTAGKVLGYIDPPTP